VQWLRDGLGLIKTSAEIEDLAATVSDNGGVYLVPAFTGLGAPHWDPYARGTIIGLTRGTTGGHLAPGGIGEHCLSDGGRARSDGSGCEYGRSGIARRRRRNGERCVDAISNRRSGRATGPAQSHRTTALAQLACWIGHRLLENTVELEEQWQQQKTFSAHHGHIKGGRTKTRLAQSGGPGQRLVER